MKRKTLKQAKPTRFVKKKGRKIEKRNFHKILQCPDFENLWVISDTYSSLKSLKKVMEDFVF